MRIKYYLREWLMRCTGCSTRSVLRLHIFLVIGIWFFIPHQQAKAFIVDHEDALNFSQIENLSVEQLQSTLNLKSHLLHASVGSIIGSPTYSATIDGVLGYSGLEEIRRQNPKFDRSNIVFQSRGNPAWNAKVDGFVGNVENIMNQGNPQNYDIFSFKFCFIDEEAGIVDLANGIDNPGYYIQKLNELEAKYPEKTIVWWTIPLETLYEYYAYNWPNHLPDQAKRMVFNDRIRAYARDNNKILFDVADLEAYDYVNNLPTTYYHTATGVTYQIMNPAFSGSSDLGHPIRGDGRIWIAKAWWMMLYQLAHGDSATPTITSSNLPTVLPTDTPTVVIKLGDANSDNLVDGIDYVIWLNHYDTTTSSSGASVGDFNNDTHIDGIDYVIWLNNYSA